MGLVFYLRNGRKRMQGSQRKKATTPTPFESCTKNLYMSFLRFPVILCGYLFHLKAARINPSAQTDSLSSSFGLGGWL